MSKQVVQDIMQQEAMVLSELSHPNIISILDYKTRGAFTQESTGKTKTRSFIATDFCVGGDIFNFLAVGGAFTSEIARYYFHQLFGAVEYMHSMGYAHSDIKLENIFVDKNFHTKLGDFGFATKDTTTKRLVGTRSYMSPELNSKKKYNLKSSDLFAMGVALFFMRTGHFPFDVATKTDKSY